MSVPVIFFTGELGGGGAESHILRVLNHVDLTRIRPIAAVCRRGGSYERLLRPEIPVVEVSSNTIRSSVARVALAGPRLAWLAKKTQAAAVVSVMDLPNLTAISSLRLVPSRPAVVCCVQIPPSIEYAATAFGRSFMLPAIRRLYPKADRIIALSSGVQDDLTAIQPGIRDAITVIHNACVELTPPPHESTSPAELPKKPMILAAGRLVPQKDYPTLLSAFALVRQTQDAELWILGDGPLRGALEQEAARLHLSEHVRFLGFRDNPRAFMKHASVFVLSSRYEGFGNVIVEAMSCGTPVVSTDCPHGPREILEGERGGLLVPVGDTEQLAKALVSVLSDQELRSRLAASGLTRALDFRADRIAASYLGQIETICRHFAAKRA